MRSTAVGAKPAGLRTGKPNATSGGAGKATSCQVGAAGITGFSRSPRMSRRTDISEIDDERATLSRYEWNQLIREVRKHQCACGSRGPMACDDGCTGDRRDAATVETLQVLLLVLRDHLAPND